MESPASLSRDLKAVREQIQREQTKIQKLQEREKKLQAAKQVLTTMKGGGSRVSTEDGKLKVLGALAGVDAFGMSRSELQTKTGLSSSSMTAVLRDLEGRVVQTNAPQRRNTRYRLTPEEVIAT